MKFLEHLKAVDTGNKQIILEPLYAIRYDTTPPSDRDYIPRFAREFSITVRLGASQYIEEDLIKASDGQVVELAVEEMRHAIAEKLYGDLRRDLQKLHSQMRNEFGYRESPSNDMLVQIIDKVTL
jgi:hypothetical protein